MDLLMVPKHFLFSCSNEWFIHKEGLLTFYMMSQSAKYFESEYPDFFEQYKDKIIYHPYSSKMGANTKYFHTLKSITMWTGAPHAYALLKPE